MGRYGNAPQPDGWYQNGSYNGNGPRPSKGKGRGRGTNLGAAARGGNPQAANSNFHTAGGYDRQWHEKNAGQSYQGGPGAMAAGTMPASSSSRCFPDSNGTG